jgi:hypothetical protein
MLAEEKEIIKGRAFCGEAISGPKRSQKKPAHLDQWFSKVGIWSVYVTQLRSAKVLSDPHTGSFKLSNYIDRI